MAKYSFIIRYLTMRIVSHYAIKASVLLVAAGMLVLSSSSAMAVTWNFKGSLHASGHSRYVPPISNPLFNETPYITTEVRPLYFYNDIPEDFISEGGSIEVTAVQLRLALTDRLGLIASKDGYADIDFDKVLPDEDGFANISLGLKYAFHSNPEKQSIASIGLEYEAPVGDLKTAGIDLQGEGDGFFDLFIAGAAVLGGIGLQANLGANFAVDTDHDSSMFHFAVHADYELLPNFFPVLEVNGFTVFDTGNRTPVDFEGVDLVSLGSSDSGTVVTAAGGARYRFNRHFQLGAAYEAPLTNREDLIDHRFYVDLVLSF